MKSMIKDFRLDPFESSHYGLGICEDTRLFNPEKFEFTGINGRIEALGDVWQFWECHGCGNATFSKPVKCEKCNGISFQWLRLFGNRHDRRRIA